MKEKRTALLLSLILFCCYGYFFPRWADWNQNSRMDLTMAIAEKGSFAIDDYYTNTGDYAVYGGHVYTDKAPGTSFLGVPTYLVFKTLSGTPPVRAALDRFSSTAALADTLNQEGTGLLEDKVYFAAALYAVTLATVSLPSALLGGMLYLFLARVLERRWLRALLVLTYGLATVVFPYSSLFYGHQIAAVLLFAAFYLLLRMRQEELTFRWLWIAGIFLGLAVLVEFPALVPASALGLYALWMLTQAFGKKYWAVALHAFRVVLAGLPFVVLLGFYNWVCFGSPISSSYKYLGNFPEISNTGFLGFSQPSLDALWGITFSPYRGLFFMSPILLLALPGFWYAAKNKAWRAEAVLLLGLVLGQLGLVSAWYDWRGGFALGPRNLLVILPFVAVGVAFCLDAWFRGKSHSHVGRLAVGAVAIAILSLLSFAITWIVAISGQELVPFSVANPLLDFSWPRFAQGDIARNLGMVLGFKSWASLVFPFLIVGGFLWILYLESPSLKDSIKKGQRREAQQAP